MSSKKFIVTGSAGFIGKALSAHLRHAGADVIEVDRRTGIEAWDLHKLLDTVSAVDCVFHLAAQTSVFNTDKEAIFRDNIKTFVNVCDACRDCGVPIIYASSSTAAFGNTSSLYGLSKRFNEEYAALYYPMGSVGVRLHNVYGPQPRQGTLLWHLMNDKAVTLYNGGDNIRHFTYVDDVVKALEMVQENFLDFLGVVNVANPQKLRVWEFARQVSERNGVEVVFSKDKRSRANCSQSLDEAIKTVHLRYKTVQEGLDAVFGLENGKQNVKCDERQSQ